MILGFLNVTRKIQNLWGLGHTQRQTHKISKMADDRKRQLDSIDFVVPKDSLLLHENTWNTVSEKTDTLFPQKKKSGDTPSASIGFVVPHLIAI